MRKLKVLLLLTMGLANGHHTVAADHRAKIKVTVCRRTASLVQLSPNPTYNGSLVLQSATNDSLHFYIFDVEGTMIYHALLLPGSRRTIGELKTGNYSYDVFRNDESVEQGKIAVLEKRKAAKPKR